MAGRPNRDYPGEGRKAEGFRRVQRASHSGSEKITADYEASPDTYVENRAASEELLAQACRVEWVD